MQVVTGGAYNGKAAWVRINNQLVEGKKLHWFNVYEEHPLPIGLENYEGTVVFNEIEQWIFQWMKGQDLEEARKYGRQIIEDWLVWEKKMNENQLIVICTDISKGIVPVDAEMRKWRDLTGWFYQDLVEKSRQVYLVWYGIAKQIK